MMLELTMTGPQGVTFEAGIQLARGMRVVLLDQDAAVRTKVRAAIYEDHGFVVAGESQQWPECEAMLDCYVPELLIASLTQVPAKFLERLSEAEFPVLVGLQEEGDRFNARRGWFDALQVPPEPQQVRSLLWRARREIYRRKADELASLLQSYVACAGKSEHYLSGLTVEGEDQTKEVALDQVLFLAADGNYVRVHTEGSTYEIRETMTGISAKLDPSRFVRVHRSFIVNLTHVLEVVTKESAAFARLSNGIEVPLGRNYRQEFDSVLQLRNRLSA
jgi:two-component system, LytTR family, response regulator